MLLAYSVTPSAHAQSEDVAWKAAELSDIITRLETADRRYESFIDTPTLRTGLYVLEAGAVDNQPVHELDEVYHVVSGKAVLRVGDDDVPVQEGSTVFVRAGADHRFHSITEELRIVVFFSKAAD